MPGGRTTTRNGHTVRWVHDPGRAARPIPSLIGLVQKLVIDELPVLESAKARRLTGILRRKETISFCNRQVLHEKRMPTE